MPAANAKPHVSKALAHLRFGVTGAGVCVAVATLMQLIVFGFVHFTDVRFTDLRPVQNRQALSVISSVADGQQAAPASVPPVETADVNRVRTGWDVGLDRLSGLAVTGGVVAALTLGMMCMMGVVVAGGGAVPGVERAVTACTWSIVLGVMCLPIGSILNSASPFPGVFGTYEQMIAASAAVNSGQASAPALFAVYVVMPFVAMAAALVIVLRFRSGIEMGIIPESLSEFDEMLEKEMATIRKRGIQSNVGGRAGTAMRQTMHEDPQPARLTTEPMTIAEAPARPAEEPVRPAPEKRKAGRAWVSANDRRLGDPNPGDPLKRPI